MNKNRTAQIGGIPIIVCENAHVDDQTGARKQSSRIGLSLSLLVYITAAPPVSPCSRYNALFTSPQPHYLHEVNSLASSLLPPSPSLFISVV